MDLIFLKHALAIFAVILKDIDLLVFLVTKTALKTREKTKLSNIQVMQGHLLKPKDSLKQ